MEQIAAQTMASTLADSAGHVEPVEVTWNSEFVAPADQGQFENALVEFDNFQQQPSQAIDGLNQLAKTPYEGTIGNVILDNLRSLKIKEESVQANVLGTLDKGELNPSEMLKVQFHMMSLSVEIQTTSNMAHHGVEDVKTIMRGQ
ncbi:hypothetical protein AB1L42_01360 [Thalassoglobus sp. JC818]|uniref:hypothetical protein n=1 Tax=Thalassoglobus sp. JC818 TaxID=3232136 RepID=UPI00345792AE